MPYTGLSNGTFAPKEKTRGDSHVIPLKVRSDDYFLYSRQVMVVTFLFLYSPYLLFMAYFRKTLGALL